MNPQFLFFIFSIGSFLWLLLWVHNLLVSFLMAFVFFFLMNPIVEKLEKRKFSRLLSTSLIFTLATVLIVIFFGAAVPAIIDQFKKLQTEWPQYASQGLVIQKKLLTLIDDYTSAEVMPQVLEKIQETGNTLAQNFFKVIPDFVSSSLTVLFLAPFLTFFMLLDGPHIMQKMIGLAPKTHQGIITKILEKLNFQIGGFIRARIIETLVIILVIWIGFLLIGFPYALVLAIFGGVLNLIPYVGPLVGAAPAFLIAFGLNSEASVFWGLTAIYAISQLIDGAILVPFLVARIVNLHPVIVILSVIVGAQMLGVLGMIISIPVSSALKVILESIYTELIDKKNQD